MENKLVWFASMVVGTSACLMISNSLGLIRFNCDAQATGIVVETLSATEFNGETNNGGIR